MAIVGCWSGELYLFVTADTTIHTIHGTTSTRLHRNCASGRQVTREACHLRRNANLRSRSRTGARDSSRAIIFPPAGRPAKARGRADRRGRTLAIFHRVARRPTSPPYFAPLGDRCISLYVIRALTRVYVGKQGVLKKSVAPLHRSLNQSASSASLFSSCDPSSQRAISVRPSISPFGRFRGPSRVVLHPTL